MPNHHPSLSARARPSAWAFFRVWLRLGLQSFGGGTATLFLIRRAVVERYGWMSGAELTRAWAICQMSPGINLLGLTILVGWRVHRAAGIVLALAGLLLPSVAITVIMTALYAQLRALAVVQAAVRGITPGTVGLGLLLALQMARPLLRPNAREGRAGLLLGLGLVAGSALVAWLARVSVVWILLGAGLVSAAATRRPARGVTTVEPRP